MTRVVVVVGTVVVFHSHLNWVQSQIDAILFARGTRELLEEVVVVGVVVAVVVVVAVLVVVGLVEVVCL